MADDGDPVDPAKAAAVAMALREDRRKWKLERLKHEAKAVERKALQSKQLLEEESRKRARTKVTLNSYFTISRNAKNRKEALDLQIPKVGDAGEGCSTGGESVDATATPGSLNLKDGTRTCKFFNLF
jgi:hypothetical protein